MCHLFSKNIMKGKKATMKVYNYDLDKTLKRTQSNNNFVRAKSLNNKCVFLDFSNLSKLEFITDREIEVIKNECVQWIPSGCTSFISGKIYNEFENVTIDVSCNTLRIYNKQGKMLYTISQINNLRLVRKQRKSIYEYKYNVSELSLCKIAYFPFKWEDIEIV